MRGGQVTLPGPGNHDTDDDGIPDAREVKDSVYWIEAQGDATAPQSGVSTPPTAT